MTLEPNSTSHTKGTMAGLENLRVAIVHDWMFQRRGGEKVVERLLDLYPQADLFLLFGRPQTCLQTQTTHRVLFSMLARLPGIESYYKLLLPLLPLATEAHDLSDYDLILSSSSCAAKGVIPPPHATHVCYVHSPMRYAWDMEREYFPAARGWKLLNPLHAIRRWLLSRLRVWDVASSARVDVFCANSDFVRRRIQLYYRRESLVVHPPVELEAFVPIRRERLPKQRTVLLFGAWVPYKKMEWALEALRQRLPRDVIIVAAGRGAGLDRAQEQFRDDPSVAFVRDPDTTAVAELYRRAHVLAYPGVEDFGIVPVEAMAAGVWVVAPNIGGARDTVRPGLTGFFFDGQADPKIAADSLAQTVLHSLEHPSPETSQELLDHLQKFSKETFDNSIKHICSKALQDFSCGRAPARDTAP
jgi:glycosyltransferase involved in cell wall biosynthesis